MRVLYLHQYFNTPDMPFGTRSYEMSKRLAAAGHEVQVITADRSAGASGPRWRTTEHEGFRVHWVRVPYSDRQAFSRRLLAFVAFALLAARKAASLKADVLFATSTPLTIAIPGVIASRLQRIPMVFEVRDLWPEVPIALGVLRDPVSRWLAHALERMAYRNSRYVIALAPGMGEGVVRAGYPSERVVVVPNGCDMDLFGAHDADARVVRSQYSWLGDRPMILYAGAIGIVNGVDYMVRMAHAAKDLDPDVRFVVVGTGKMDKAVRDLAETLGVLDQNFFMMGALPKKEVPGWMAASTISIALLTGPREVWKDSTSNKFFDSLAAGKPVANNFDGWSARIAADAGAGLMLDPAAPEAAAALLCARARDDEWLRSAGDASRRLGTERFCRDDLARDFIATIERAASEGTGRIPMRPRESQ